MNITVKKSSYEFKMLNREGIISYSPGLVLIDIFSSRSKEIQLMFDMAFSQTYI